MRHILTLISLLLFTCASAQTSFMQRVKLSNSDSASINISEVRVMYENADGTGRFIYGYPNSTLDTRSDYDDILADACGNLVNIVAVQPSGTKRMAFNPQWVYRVYILSGKTKIQLRETNQIFESPWSYFTVSSLLAECLAGGPAGGDTDPIPTNEGILGVAADGSNGSVITSNTVGANGVTINGSTTTIVTETTSTNGGQITIQADTSLLATVNDVAAVNCRWCSVKHAMPFYSNNPQTAFEALRTYWSTRMGEIVVDTTVLLTANTTVAASVRFVGGGNINVDAGHTVTFQSTVDAEPKHFVFTGAGNYRFNQKSVATLYVYWFGALGNNSADDYDEMQKAINSAIASGIVDVSMLDGIHRTSKGLLIRNSSSTVTLRFHGQTNYDGGIGSTIYRTDTTTFAIGIQGARNVTVENMYLSGKQNGFNPTLAQIITTPEATYDNNLGRNSRYSPYSGIVIDPFKNSAPADGGYPGFSAMYDSTHATSSSVTINGVVARYFISGITISPTGSANGAEIEIDGCTLDRNMFGIATGSSQNRDVQVTGTSVALAKYGMIGTRFGAQNGAMPIFSNGQISSVKFMGEFNSTIGDCRISDTYGESVWAIGNWTGRGAALSFTNVEVNFATDSETGVGDAPCVLTCLDMPFVMEGGSLTYSNFRPVNLFVFSGLFKGTLFNRPVLNLMNNGLYEDAIQYETCKFLGYANLQSNYRSDHKIDAVDYRNTRNVFILRDTKVSYGEGDGTTDLYNDGSANYVVYSQVTQNKQWTPILETKVVTVDTTSHTATFTTSFPGKYREGDILGFAASSRTPNGAETNTDLGIVTNVSGGTVTLEHTPMGVVSSEYQLELFEMPIFTGTWRGVIDSGTNKLIVTSKPLTASGENASNRWPVGTRVYSKQATRLLTGIPRGTYVTSVVADTIYLSCTTDTTYEEIEFFNADLRATMISRNGRWPKETDTLRSISFQRGDEILFTQHQYRRKATVVLGGFTPVLNFDFKNIYGDYGDIPTPDADDIGLQYFATDSAKVYVWDGATWQSVSGTGVNIYNSNGSQTDAVRRYTADSTQMLTFGHFPSPGVLNFDGTEKGFFYQPSGNGIGIVNGVPGVGQYSNFYVYPNSMSLDTKYSAGGLEYIGQYNLGSGNMTLGGYESITGNLHSLTAYSDAFASRLRLYANQAVDFGDTTSYLDIYQSTEDAPLRNVKYIAMSERRQSGGSAIGSAAYLGYNRSTGSPSEVTMVGSKFGFGVQHNVPGSSPAIGYNYLFVNLENFDTTQSNVSLYQDSYFFANAIPSPTVGDTSVHVWAGNGTGTDPMFMTLDEMCQHCTAGLTDVNIYRNDGLLKAGGTTVGLDSGSLKLTLATTAAATKYGIEMTGTTATASNRFLSMKTETDSMRIQEFGSEFYAITNKSLQFNISDQERHVADSVQWIEGSVQDVDSTRFILATTANGWMKRFDASDLGEGDMLAVRGSNWKKVKGPIGWYRTITGTSETEMFLNGSSTRATLAASTIWTGTVECTGTVTTVGNGSTIVVGDAVALWQPITIKRVGSSTTMMTPTLGTTVEGWIDANMSGATFTVSADDTNEALKITFTPPSLAGSTTVCKATCTFTFNELKY